MRRCPPAGQLEQFLDESLEPTVHQSIAGHVAGCAACQAVLESLTADIPLRDSLCSHLGVTAPGSAPAISFLADLKRTAPRNRAVNGTSGAKTPQIAGYEILGKLGRGGMAVVYRARHEKLDRIVALKMIVANDEVDPRSRVRFRQEAEAVARLHHPGIVQIYDVGEAAGYPYLALEYMAGGSLAGWLQGTPQPVDATVALVEIVARAVHFAHQHQIIHRDLKPANILMCPKFTVQGSKSEVLGPWNLEFGLFEPKITDFGLAKRLDAGGSPTQSGEMIGTPSYMAPEQAGDGSVTFRPRAPVGPATDIYALGAILYEMLTGRPPFKGPTPLDTVLQVLHEEPVRPGSLRPGLPVDLETICLKCLDKDPRKRYATAEALADDLHCFRSGKPIHARPVGTIERLGKWARRRPAQALLVAAVIVVTALGFAGVTWQWLETRVEKKNVEIEKQNTEVARQREADQRHIARSALYYSRIVQSQLYLRVNDVTSAADSLARCVPQSGHEDRRGWEWYYLEGQLHRDLWTLPLAHGGTSGALAFSTAGDRVAAVVDGTGAGAVASFRMWSLRTGAAVASLDVPATVHRLALHPDGRRVLLAGKDGSVRVWDIARGKELTRCHVHDDVISAIAIRPGGNEAASASWDGTVRVWDIETGRVRKTVGGQDGRAQTVAWHPEGRSLAAGYADHSVKIWNVLSGNVRTLKGHKSPVSCIAFSPDGDTLVSAGSNGNFRLWNLREQMNDPVSQKVTSPGGAVLSIAFSPDGRSLAYGSTDATVRLWDIDAGIERMLFRGHHAAVESVAFNPDGTQLVSLSPEEGVIKLWDRTRHPEFGTFAWTGTDVEAMSLSVSERQIHCLTAAGHLQTWAIDSSMMLAEHVLPIRTADHQTGVVATFDPAGKRLAGQRRFDPHEIRIWDVASGKHLSTLRVQNSAVVRLRFSPDGKQLAIGSDNAATANGSYEIKIWQLETHAERLAMTGHGRLYDFTFSPDGAFLAVGAGDGLRLLRLHDGRTFKAGAADDGRVRILAFSPHGTFLASSSVADRIVRVWARRDMDGEPVWRLVDRLVTTGFVRDLAFSPDGSRLAGVTDDAVKMWEVATGHEVLTLWGAQQRHRDPPFHPRVTFSKDGSRLVASHWNESMSMWQAPDRVSASAVIARQARRRQAAEARRSPWQLREAEQSLAQHNGAAARFHLRHVDSTRLSPPLQERYHRLLSQITGKSLLK